MANVCHRELAASSHPITPGDGAVTVRCRHEVSLLSQHMGLLTNIHLQNSGSSCFCGDAHGDLTVKAPCPPQSWIQRIGSIRRSCTHPSVRVFGFCTSSQSYRLNNNNIDIQAFQEVVGQVPTRCAGALLLAPILPVDTKLHPRGVR